jgi:hypothetical protein
VFAASSEPANYSVDYRIVALEQIAAAGVALRFMKSRKRRYQEIKPRPRNSCSSCR